MYTGWHQGLKKWSSRSLTIAGLLLAFSPLLFIGNSSFAQADPDAQGVHPSGLFVYGPWAAGEEQQTVTPDGTSQSQAGGGRVLLPLIRVGGSHLPTAVNDSYATPKNTELSVSATNGVLANDSAPDQRPLQAVLVDDVSHGALTLNDDGSFDYTPELDFTGQDSFTYQADNGANLSNLATVTLPVSGSSNPPLAVDDEYETSEDTPLNVNAADGVLANDSAPEQDLLQTVLVDDATRGDLTLNLDGSFDYSPTAGFNGQDSFRYKADDGTTLSNLATVTLTVTAVNNAPVAVDDTYETPAETLLSVNATDGVLANDADPDQDPLQAVLVDDASNGDLTLDPDGSFDYVPASGFSGQDSFTYRADDGVEISNLATVALTVNGVNGPPVALNDSYTTSEDTDLSVNAADGVLANDKNRDQDSLQATLVDDVSNGDLTLNPDGSFDYSPVSGFNGQDSFTYQADDGAALSNSAMVTITITPPNRAPRIVSGALAFSKQVIGTDVNETHSAVAADLDRDGDIDIAATDYIDGMVLWYENDGDGNFAEKVMDANLVGAYPSHVGDVDGDGHADALAAGYDGDTFAWYRNNGGGSFTREDIDTAADGAHSIVTIDLDEDGDIDFVTSSQDADNIAWYENDGDENFTKKLIDTAALAAKRAEVADINGDGNLDVVAASFDSDEIAWHENDGDENFTKRVIYTGADGAYFVSLADVDGVNGVDVFSASQYDNKLAWYRNDGDGNFTTEIIETGAFGARTVIAADVNGDGDVDAVAASVNDNTIAWHENDGNGNFTKRPIDMGLAGAYGLSKIDIDYDGDIDIISASRDANEVTLHRQFKTHATTVALNGELTINSSLLHTEDEDNDPAELTYSVTAAPKFGSLQLNGAPVNVGDTFTQDDINNGRLKYRQSGSTRSLDEFVFTVADGGGSGVQPAGGVFVLSIFDTVVSLVELPLDEAGGTVAHDVSGMNNHGTLVNGPSFAGSTGDGSTSSVRFDGVDDYIDLGALDARGTGLTLAGWFHTDSYPGTGSEPRLIAKASGNAANQHIFMFSTVQTVDALRLQGRVRAGGTVTTVIANSGNIVAGAWRHGAMTYDGATVRLYLDGVEVGNAPLSGALDVDPSMAVTVGNQPSGTGDYAFHGLLDDIRILARAMGPAEIIEIATRGN